MPPHLRRPRLLLSAGAVWIAMLTVLPASRADENVPTWADGWHITTQGPYGFTSGGAPGSFFFQSTPGTAFASPNGTRGFTDILAERSLGFGRELGLDNLQATVGARVAEPLITNGFTPAYDDRRYVGVGPRLGLEGSKKLSSSWSLDWQIGAAVLFGDRGASVGDGVTSLLPNYTGSSSSVVNIDGLLGLSYWFSTASKLMLGYRADAYLKGTGNFAVPTVANQSADRIDHGPMVRFSVEK
jgi:major outer membrane protein